MGEHKAPVRIGIVGCGRWGPNHIRAFQSLSGATVTACCDKDGAKAMKTAETFHINGYVEPATMYDREDIDAVVIATPTLTHYDMVMPALEANLDVLCEKPMEVSVTRAREIQEAAGAKERIVMVGHVFLYNAGILYLKRLLEDKIAGKRIYYVYCRRTNLGPVRSDVGAVADLATHDISVLNYLFESKPEVEDVQVGRYLHDKREDVAFVTLKYGDILVSLHASWLDPVKMRQITIVGSDKMIIWDDLRADGPVAIYDKRVAATKAPSTYGEFMLSERHGGMGLPSVTMQEPLKTQAQAFVDAVNTRQQPLSDVQMGVDVAQTLTEIQVIAEVADSIE